MELAAGDITVRFGGLVAIEGVSLALRHGEILGLIGPNGAGKTTLVNVLSGFQRPHAGRVAIEGREARRRGPVWFARSGVVRTFQAVRLFPKLSVSENVEVACVGAGAGRAPGAAPRPRDAGLPRPRPSRRRARRHADLWRRAACRPRPRAGARAALPPARRARGRPQHRRGRDPSGDDPGHPRHLRLRRAGDRAQHGAGHGGLRARARPGHGPDPGVRDARRDARTTSACGRPISEPRPRDRTHAPARRAPGALLRVSDLVVRYGSILALAGRVARRPSRRDRRRRRPQRRGQVYAAGGHRRASFARARAPSSSTASPWTRASKTPSGAASRSCRRGVTSSPG